MFHKFLGKKESDQAKSDGIKEKISQMDLTQMRAFVNNKEEITEEGIIEVLKKLIAKNETTSKRYIEIDDMDVKIKKGFDLVLSIASHKKLTLVAIELIHEFVTLYSDIIEKFDRENKQIYAAKFVQALENGVAMMEEVAKLKRKMDLLHQ
ncbi:MAG: hypothetical protein AB7U24_02455 [Sulfurimonadaceae bacterium]|jgi:hypothetical protein